MWIFKTLLFKIAFASFAVVSVVAVSFTVYTASLDRTPSQDTNPPIEKPSEDPIDPIEEPTEDPVDEPQEPTKDPVDEPIEEPQNPTTPEKPKDEPKEPTKPTEPVEEPKEPQKPVEEPKEPTTPTKPKDTTAPVISGANDITIDFGSSFNPMAGVSAADNVDGDVTGRIVVTGTVNTNKSGTYTLTYKVKDNAGNEATKTRKVTVKQSVYTFNQELTNRAIEEQRNRRLDFNRYVDQGGEQVPYFDEVFLKYISGEFTAEQVRNTLGYYEWDENGITYRIFPLELNVRSGETTGTTGSELLSAVYYANHSSYNRIRVYTNAEGVNKVYWLQFRIY